ncbi:hypothetical protein CR164_12050 [Prosthecochloris marina]|uniref:Uncharacterized protein n=1 Tax=Prosthecochloris marina TaxID=2017681 RepID=A0A317T5X3_9CHLB|nr:hypothetical protein CR164_12050 [Prosthecochloris marina]
MLASKKTNISEKNALSPPFPHAMLDIYYNFQKNLPPLSSGKSIDHHQYQLVMENKEKKSSHGQENNIPKNLGQKSLRQNRPFKRPNCRNRFSDCRNTRR